MHDAVAVEPLRMALHADVAAFVVTPHGSAAQRSVRRLQEVARHSPAFLCLLAEPWLNEAGDGVADTLLQCARIHLYARVLDDALDENLPHDRLHLLRIQPLYWRAVHALGSRYPALGEAGTALIDATVQAVARDDSAPAPRHWGVKNHHLLLAPLMLSGDSAAYRSVRDALSCLICVAQALDEVRQGALRDRALATALLDSLPDWLDERNVAALQLHGWHGAARRLLGDGKVLLAQLQQYLVK